MLAWARYQQCVSEVRGMRGIGDSVPSIAVPIPSLERSRSRVWFRANRAQRWRVGYDVGFVRIPSVFPTMSETEK